MDDAEKLIELALAEARRSGDDVPVGCVIVRAGEILARAHNQRIAACDPTAHAEVVAMREAAQSLQSWRLDGCELYVTLEPCPMCAEAIIQARFSKVVFGAYDPLYGATGSAFNLFAAGRTFPIPEVVGGVKQQECGELLKAFFRRRREEAKLEKLKAESP